MGGAACTEAGPRAEGRGPANVMFQTWASTSTQTSVASDWDVWTQARPDAAAGRNPELRTAPAGLRHNCVGRRPFKSGRLKLFNSPGWARRKGAFRKKLEEAGESRTSFLPYHSKNVAY